jgi:hypothetical protein
MPEFSVLTIQEAQRLAARTPPNTVPGCVYRVYRAPQAWGGWRPDRSGGGKTTHHQKPA